MLKGTKTTLVFKCATYNQHFLLLHLSRLIQNIEMHMMYGYVWGDDIWFLVYPLVENNKMC